MSVEKGDPSPWPVLLKDFTQDTTLHGIRFITLQTKYFIRRILWTFVLLTGFSLFVYFAVVNLIRYYDYPKTVNVDVTYKSALPFPAVTLCNQNFYRLTALQEMGLYDQVISKVQGDHKDTEVRDIYTYEGDVCYQFDANLQDLFKDVLSPIPVFNVITESGCEHMCSTVQSQFCNYMFYDRNQQSCILVKKYDKTKWNDLEKDKTCENKTIEVYRKHRFTDDRDVVCDGDIQADCSFEIDYSQEDSWIITKGKGISPEVDHTLNTEYGGYWSMIETDSRPGDKYSASMITPYRRFNGSCLELYFQFTGSSPDSRILVKATDQSAQSSELMRVKNPLSTDTEGARSENRWRRAGLTLPLGLYSISITGTRGNAGQSGIHLDDISIKQCSNFKQECKRFPVGDDYQGTSTDLACLTWSNVNTPNHYDFPDKTLAEASNFCRNPNNDPLGPWCFQKDSRQQQTYYCGNDIQFCECDSSNYFSCKNGQCIPNVFTCDGKFDCGGNDLSDETIPCENQQSVSCNFETAFACGYHSPLKYNSVLWKRDSGENVFTQNGPKKDRYGSTLGMFMIVDSTLGIEGEISRLVAPQANYSEPTCLKFWLFKNISSTNALASLTLLRQENIDGTIGEKLKVIKGFENVAELGNVTEDLFGWSEYQIPLPVGSYFLGFEVTLGYTFESDFAIDDVTLTKGNCTSEPPENQTERNGSINCNFDQSLCGYTTRSTTSYGYWQRVTKSSVSNIVNGFYREDCLKSTNGKEYSGALARTENGTWCQRWDSQMPHNHPYSDEDFPDTKLSYAANFCRNPGGNKSKPWCYTVDPDVVWQYCSLELCSSKCRQTESGVDYSGTLSTANYGYPCLPWHNYPNYFDINSFPETEPEDAKNYCRVLHLGTDPQLHCLVDSSSSMDPSKGCITNSSQDICRGISCSATPINYNCGFHGCILTPISPFCDNVNCSASHMPYQCQFVNCIVTRVSPLCDSINCTENSNHTLCSEPLPREPDLYPLRCDVPLCVNAPAYCDKTFYDSEGVIESPSYPELYPNNKKCIWTISAPEGSSISLEFEHFDVEPDWTCAFDYVQLIGSTDTDETSAKRFCDTNAPEPTDIPNTHILKVRFASDGSVRRSGFRIRYKVTYGNNTDFVMAVQYLGQQWSSDHVAQLVSSPFTVEGEICLSFMVYSRSGFQIRLVNPDQQKERLIFKTTRSGGEAWHKMSMTRNLGPSYGNWHASFESVFSATPNFFMALDDVVIEAGSCRKSTTRNPSCDFSDINLCGYENTFWYSAAPQAAWWKRESSHDKSGNNTYLAIELSETGSAPILWTPHFETKGLSCIELRYGGSSAGGEMRVYALSVRWYFWYLTKDTSSTKQWHKVHFNLNATGLFQLLFFAKGTKGDVFFLDDINMLEGECPNENDVLFLQEVSQEPGPQQDTILLNNTRSITKPFLIIHDIKEIDPGSLEKPIRSTRKDTTRFVSLSHFFKKAAHKPEDFIYECKWEGHECSPGSIETVETDMGICYTFNQNTENRLHMRQTGSHFGLSLILNVEQYEHVPGPNVDAGVKIHLHDQEDVPKVRDLGAGVPLGTHSLVKVQYTVATSLGRPYGTCDEKELELFPNSTYTFNRCVQQCETASITDLCKCKDIYMPGNATFCNLNKYFECVLKNFDASLNTSDSDLCGHCPDACGYKAFTTEMSFATLSSLTANELVSNKNQSGRLMENFKRAVEIRHRVDPELLHKTITGISEITSCLRRFLDLAEHDASMTPTSRFVYIRDATVRFIRMARDDIHKVFDNVQKLLDAWMTVYGHQRKAAVESIEVNTNQLLSLLQTLYYISMTDGDKIVLVSPLLKEEDFKRENLDKYNQWAQDCAVRLLFALQQIEKEDHIGGQIMTAEVDKSLIPNKKEPDQNQQNECKYSRGNYTEVVKKILQKLRDKNSTYGSNVTEIHDQYRTLVDDGRQLVQNVFTNISECMVVYEKFLRNITSWLLKNEVTNGNLEKRLSTLAEDFKFEKEAKQLKDDCKYFETLQNMMANYSMNKSDLVQLFQQSKLVSINNKIELLRLATVQNLATPLDENLATIKSHILASYSDALLMLRNLSRFFTDGTVQFEGKAKEMEIWRSPWPDSQIDNLIQYKYLPSEVWRTWPATKDIEAFAGARADVVITNILREAILPLHNTMSSIKSELVTVQGSFGVCTQNLVAILNDFVKDNDVGENFVLNNFLKLDVYYGELKYESVQQQKGYSFLDYLGDVGGYMGLLLGASVMTMFEVLDLLCYNTLRKIGVAHRRTTKIDQMKGDELPKKTHLDDKQVWVIHK